MLEIISTDFRNINVKFLISEFRNDNSLMYVSRDGLEPEKNTIIESQYTLFSAEVC